MVHPIPSKALGAQTVFQPQSLCPNGTICSYCVPNLAAYAVAEHAQAKRIISGLDPRGSNFRNTFCLHAKGVQPAAIKFVRKTYHHLSHLTEPKFITPAVFVLQTITAVLRVDIIRHPRWV